jgi:hypothetical protein
MLLKLDSTVANADQLAHLADFAERKAVEVMQVDRLAVGERCCTADAIQVMPPSWVS